MSKASFIVGIIVGLAVAGAGMVLPPAAYAAEGETISKKIAKPMKAAQEAIQKEQWDQALAKIREAQAVDGRTAYDNYQINEFLGYVFLKQRKYGDAAKAFEENLNSGRMPADQTNDRLKTLVQLYTVVKSYPKVSEYGSRWLKADGKDIETKVLVGQAYYLQKNFRTAVSILDGVVDDAQKAGKKVEENWLQLIRSSYAQLDDSAGARRTLEQLVRYYPKAEYWDYLLDTLLRQKSSDQVTLNVYRLMLQVGVLSQPDDFTEMTEMLIEAGLPGEAKRVMEAGYARKVFETEDKTRADRYARLFNNAKNLAEADRKILATAEAEAQKATSGQPDVALGLAYASFEQYGKAAEAIPRGLQKGGVRNPDQAKMVLGISNLKIGNKPDAVKAFEQVKGEGDPQMSEIARLWTIYTKNSG